VGAAPDLEADTYSGVVRPGDLFLIATDGLTGMLDDNRLQEIIASRLSPGRLVDTLIHEANGRGGLDNITVIAVQVIATTSGGADRPTADYPGVGATPSA
jgi:serine/threonine protein phosphatase PrpC